MLFPNPRQFKVVTMVKPAESAEKVEVNIRIMLCSLLGIDVGRYRDRIYLSVAAVSVV